MDFLKKIEGSKTYIAMIILGAVGIAYNFDLIDGDKLLAIWAVVGPIGGVALRAGIKKSEKSESK